MENNDFKDIYPESKMDIEKVQKIAEAHVNWFLQIIRPLLVEFSIHFYGHGVKDAQAEDKKVPAE